MAKLPKSPCMWGYYFGPDNGICTALGLKAAKHYLATGSCPRGRK